MDEIKNKKTISINGVNVTFSVPTAGQKLAFWNWVLAKRQDKKGGDYELSLMFLSLYFEKYMEEDMLFSEDPHEEEIYETFEKRLEALMTMNSTFTKKIIEAKKTFLDDTMASLSEPQLVDTSISRVFDHPENEKEAPVLSFEKPEEKDPDSKNEFQIFLSKCQEVRAILIRKNLGSSEIDEDFEPLKAEDYTISKINPRGISPDSLTKKVVVFVNDDPKIYPVEVKVLYQKEIDEMEMVIPPQFVEQLDIEKMIMTGYQEFHIQYRDKKITFKAPSNKETVALDDWFSDMVDGLRSSKKFMDDFGKLTNAALMVSSYSSNKKLKHYQSKYNSSMSDEEFINEVIIPKMEILKSMSSVEVDWLGGLCYYVMGFIESSINSPGVVSDF